MFSVFGGVAGFEREMMLECQRKGIAKAKAAGKDKGRKPTARARAGEVIALHSHGINLSEIARKHA
jgi:DNA invertase Pin-like site-specific DNA recombinase